MDALYCLQAGVHEVCATSSLAGKLHTCAPLACAPSMLVRKLPLSRPRRAARSNGRPFPGDGPASPARNMMLKSSIAHTSNTLMQVHCLNVADMRLQKGSIHWHLNRRRTPSQRGSV